MAIGRELGKKLLEKASNKVGDALSRADLLGGKMRDRVIEKLAELKTSAPPPTARTPPPAAPRPTVQPPVAGLGDPNRPAQVFGRRSCPWTGRALALLESNRIEHTYFELDTYGGDGVLRELKLETKQQTVPYVFVRGRFVGGFNALDELQRLGQLDYLILSNDERARHPMHGRIEVAKRLHDGELVPGG